MRSYSQKTAVAAGVFGLAGVGLGAFGAHAMYGFLLRNGTLSAWQTAVNYQLMHALALLGMVGWMTSLASPGGYSAKSTLILLKRAVYCWSAGIVLFSGSLYLVAINAPGWVGAVTPIGGLLLMAGWGWVAWAGWMGRS